MDKNYIEKCLEEFGEKFTTENRGTSFKFNLVPETIKTFLKQKLQQVEAHETEDGYCCACEYDIACMNEKIEIAIQKKVEEIIEIISKMKLWSKGNVEGTRQDIIHKLKNK